MSLCLAPSLSCVAPHRLFLSVFVVCFQIMDERRVAYEATVLAELDAAEVRGARTSPAKEPTYIKEATVAGRINKRMIYPIPLPWPLFITPV